MGSALGQAHWPPPQAGATWGRWPTVPGVTHLIACAQVGPIRTPGGPPKFWGRVPHQRLLRALVTPPPPRSLQRWSLPPSIRPQGRPPCLRPLPCFLAPAMSRLPLLSAPALAHWCPLFLVFLFFSPLASRLSPRRFGVSSAPPNVPSLSPSCPRPFLGWVEEKGVEGGGRPRCPSSGVSTSQARHRHEARHLSLCRGGGLAVWPPSSSYLSCGRTPGGPPVRACTARAPFGHGRVVPPAFSLRCLPTLPRCPWGGVRIPLPSSSLSPLSSSLCSTPVAGMTQAQRKHRAWLQRFGGGFPLGPPYPRGRALQQRSMRAHVTPAFPRAPWCWSPSSRFLPPALGLLRSWFFFFLSPPLAARLFPWHVGLSSIPPRCPLATSLLSSPLSLVGGGEGGGGALAVRPPS